MKVLIVNTSELTGGAAVAANRLAKALNHHGVEAKMLVLHRQTDKREVVVAGSRWGNWLRFCYERLVIFLHNGLSRRNLFAVSISNTGFDVTKTPEFREADVIHLHWVNQGMLSLKGIRRILDSGKPVVWTMHDMWPATAICHYAHDCEKFEKDCSNCDLLRSSSLSKRIWKQKLEMLSRHRISFVSCSRWLQGQAEQSLLLKGQAITNIPNAIDTHFFHSGDKEKVRQKLHIPIEKRLILFVSQRVTDSRKGISFLIEAIKKLSENHPEMKENTAIAILGAHADELAEQLSLPVYPLGYVENQEKIVEIYNAADVFVLPSLSDNLPNTIMEAMACGVPCVGFDVGGIPEMIDHRKNGYVAKFRDADDLADGIRWVLAEADYKALSEAAVRKVKENYSEQQVAARYLEIYQEALGQQAKTLKND